MPSADISVYISAILGVIIAGLGIAYWKQSYELETCEAQASSFREQVNAEGLASKLAINMKEQALEDAIDKLRRELGDANSKLNTLYADNERLRKLPKGNPSRGGIINLADAASRISCPDARAEFAERLERLDIGVRERILKSRDEAILRTIACKKYAETVTSIINAGSENAPILD
jgi:hypothetical protein